MLSGVGIAHEFWLEAFDTTCYLVNSSLLMDLLDETPYEAWTRKNPSFHISESFGVMPLCMYPKIIIIKKNLTTSMRNASSLGAKME